MTYHLKMQIANIGSNGNINSLLLYPNFKDDVSSIKKSLGYSLCNEVDKHYYYLWFPNLYNMGEVITIPTITCIYEGWCLARVRPANKIEEFDFKYHIELKDLLERDSIGLLFELGNKNEQSKMG